MVTTTSFKDIEHINILAWIIGNQVKTETGQELDFYHHRYLVSIYKDNSPNIVEMKAAQLGLTTMEIVRSFHRAYNQGLDIIYILPTFTDVKDFSGGKVNRIVDQNECLQEWVKDKDSTEQKRVGKSTIYYRGSWNERQALMIAADWLILDEFDRCKQEVLEQYESRLQHSKFGYKSIFSNPSKPDFGVHKYYQITDMKKWHVKHSCGKIFVLGEDCIDYKQEIYKCPHCKTEITDECRRMGEWIGTAKGRAGWSGYWIPLWVNPKVSAAKIAEAKRTKTPEFFANFVAGLPYLNTNDMLSQKLLENNLTQETNTQTGRVIIGVDTGHNIHYTLANKEGIFYHGYINSVAENMASDSPIPNYDPYTELDTLMGQTYKNAVMIADQGGDLIGIRKLQAKYKNRVYLCWFVKETRTQELIRWGENDEFGKVLVDRNRTVQMVVDEIKDQRFPIFGDKEEWQPYFDHWLNIYRVREVQGEEGDPQYNWRWVWKRKGADHWAMATVYARVGLDRFAQDLAEIVQKSGNNFMKGVPTGRIFNINDDSSLNTRGEYRVEF